MVSGVYVSLKRWKKEGGGRKKRKKEKKKEKKKNEKRKRGRRRRKQWCVCCVRQLGLRFVFECGCFSLYHLCMDMFMVIHECIRFLSHITRALK